MIAVVIIGGQTLSLALTLLATPVVYSLLDDLGERVRAWRPARRPVTIRAPGAPDEVLTASESRERG